MPSSPIFLAGLEAYNALDALNTKIRNVRRPLTKTELYALDLCRSQTDKIDDFLERAAVKAVVDA